MDVSIAEVLSGRELARFIQHTLIGTGVTAAEIERHCAECVEYGFDAAMVAGSWVELAAKLLAGSTSKVASAADFPLGIMSTRGRVAEVMSLVELGADEVDVTFPVSWMRSGDPDRVARDLTAVVEAARPAPIKIMMELALLTAEEQELGIRIAVDSGAQWLKNASSGRVAAATPESIAFLRQRAPAAVRIKASGSIGTADSVRALLAAGADLVGTSSAVSIVSGGNGAASSY
jgi:deoxyribose-phosphate aldolase